MTVALFCRRRHELAVLLLVNEPAIAALLPVRDVRYLDQRGARLVDPRSTTKSRLTSRVACRIACIEAATRWIDLVFTQLVKLLRCILLHNNRMTIAITS